MGRIADETESLIERVDLVSKARHEVSKVAFSCVLGCLNTTWLASQVHSPLAVDLIDGSFLIYILGYAIVLQPLRQVFAHLHQSQTFSKSPHEKLVAGSMLELGHMEKYFSGKYLWSRVMHSLYCSESSGRNLCSSIFLSTVFENRCKSLSTG